MLNVFGNNQRYIYCGELEVENWNEGIDLLEAAYKYEVEDLVQKCGRFLEDVISLSNVCYIYDKASTCSLPVLQHKCLKLILDAGFVVLRSEAFEVLNKDCVMDIVTSSDLNIDSELIVFETLFRWARIECCRTGLAITEANILNQIKPFLQHVCIDDMSDADKSALPPTILSCVKPNNRNRIGFSVSTSLFLHSKSLELDINQNRLDFIGEHLSCLRFSIDFPVHLVGLLQRTQINQRVWHDVEIVLRQPAFLKAGDIYHLYAAMDVGTDAQCPQTILFNNVLHTASGYVNFTAHGDETWGIRSLIVI
ncbi:hypothetical protein TNIN_192461 [Trichonephila inaurata madagascariensis]|uniref:BACK domain-containing protein n=1 Tax=Trichonephila inaurata madagascariensis TaxID=2747483 RepID=A0A8X6MDC8_9ARAC|nr:hypothetical protein TNIN_192461 [Trichonephila inaurata madagascariensis]